MAALQGKKSAPGKHMSMLRVEIDSIDRARLAANLLRVSLSDYASTVLREAAEQHILAEAQKIVDQKDC